MALILFHLWAVDSVAQNLVRNNSFEEGQPECGPTLFPDDYGKYATHWECPTNGTTDLFSTQLPQNCFGGMPGWYFPPYMGYRTGKQMPRTGNEFAGLFVYSKQEPEDYREYLQTRLLEPLVKGESYCAEMYISLGDRVEIAVDKVGMAFKTKRTRIYGFNDVLPLKPKVIYPDVLEDSINWTQVSGNFIADSAYNYLVIGNFFKRDELRKIVQQGKRYLYREMSYYFIDDVSVTRIPNEIEFDGDKIICQGASAKISVNWNWESIEWRILGNIQVIGNGKEIIVEPKVTTRYLFKGSFCKKTVTDTVEITVLPFIAPELGKDTVICENTDILLTTPEQYAQYTWQDGSVLPHYKASKEGIYSVRVSDPSGCYGSDTITIGVLKKPHVGLGSDQVVCDWREHSGIGLTAVAGESYEWSTTETNSFIRPGEQGEYWLMATNRCGNATDTIRLYSFEHVFIPNVVTPNGDGKNEHFEILGLPPGLYPNLEIYNRTGKSIAMFEAYRGGWPSRQTSNELPSGIYYYAVTLPGCRSYKGWLQVLK